MHIALPQLCAQLGIPVPARDLADRSLANLAIRGVNTLELASETDLCFVEGADQADAVAASLAGAVLVPLDFPADADPRLIRVPEPRVGFFRIAELFSPRAEVRGLHETAVIDPGAALGDGVTVGAHTVIADGVQIGDRVVIGPGCYLGPGVSLGADCVLEANVTLQRDTRLGARCRIHSGTVIGGDGFGYRWDGQAHRKVPQLGRVTIEDDVEIGSNCCVDRATLGVTRIRQGTKIDNLVQIAHNTDIGAHVILVSQAGVAGSARVGAGAVIAGQVAVSDHVTVGAGARIGGQSGVTKDVPAGTAVFGTPARPLQDTLKELAALAQLPSLIKQIRAQRKEIADLQRRLAALESGR